MPLYEYGCKCGKTKEVTHRIIKKPRITCECGKRMQKILFAPLVDWSTDCPSASGGKECK